MTPKTLWSIVVGAAFVILSLVGVLWVNQHDWLLENQKTDNIVHAEHGTRISVLETTMTAQTKKLDELGGDVKELLRRVK